MGNDGACSIDISVLKIQGLLTSVYISALSALAERLAARMRQQLFQSLIVQDIAFFDSNKTGELVNRSVIIS